LLDCLTPYIAETIQKEEKSAGLEKEQSSDESLSQSEDASDNAMSEDGDSDDPVVSQNSLCSATERKLRSQRRAKDLNQDTDNVNMSQPKIRII